MSACGKMREGGSVGLGREKGGTKDMGGREGGGGWMEGV